MTTPRILVVALVVFFEFHAAQEASPVELPRLSGMVNGFASFLEVGYAEDPTCGWNGLIEEPVTR